MSSLEHVLSRSAQSVQNSMLLRAKQNGPAECFLRRTLRLSAIFEGGRVTSLQEADRTELALRVFRDGKVGLAGGTLPHDKISALGCVERAEASAKSGPAGTISAPAIRLPPKSEMPSLPSPDALVARICELHSRLREYRPSVLWSGKVNVVQHAHRVVHSGGLDAWGGLTEYQVGIRARCAADQAPVDRLLYVCTAEWAEAIHELTRRVEAEFPESEKMRGAPEGVPVALGPTLVAKLCLEVIKSRLLLESHRLDRKVSLVDEPISSQQGCDEEGVVVEALPVFDAGCFCEPWAAGTDGRALLGRAFRPTIDSSPVTTPISFRWVGTGVDCVRRVVLLSEVAGLSRQPDGSLRGTAVEGIVLEQGIPVERCRGCVLQLHPVTGLKDLIGEVTANRFAVGRHRMPQVVLA